MTNTFEDGVLTINTNTVDNLTRIKSDISQVIIKDGVTTINEYVFQGCTSLVSVTFPESLETINEYAFADCSSLVSVTFPESIKTIREAAFYGCSSLDSVDLSQTNLKIIEQEAFERCSSLASVTFPEALQTIGEFAFFNCSSLVSVTFPDALQTIGWHAFEGCASLASVTFPEALQTIGECPFTQCPDLIIFCRPGLAIPNFPEERVNRTVHAALSAFLGTALSARRPEGLMRYAMRNRLGGRMSLLVTRASIDTNRPTLADLRQAIADIEHESTRREIKDWALGQLQDINIHEYGGM